MSEFEKMVQVRPSRKPFVVYKPLWSQVENEDPSCLLEHEYFEAVEVSMPKHEWERVQRIMELYELSNKHPAMRDLAMQYHMMYELLKGAGNEEV